MGPQALLVALGLVAARTAVAEDGELRLGLFVGNNTGAPGQPSLVWARSDASKMRDLFVEYGDIAPGDARLIEDRSRPALSLAFNEVRNRLAAAHERGQRTMLVFFYSGHGDEEGLQLGATRLTHDTLRQWLDDSGADVRIALLDACRSGNAIRTRGTEAGPAYQFAVTAEQAHGTAILTSSAEAQLAQESDELGGGFFTYYLHSALSGAADADSDGRVSLTETYTHVHRETAFRASRAATEQTPAYDFDISGTGDVVLTHPGVAEASVVFPADLDGTFQIWDAVHKRYVAEVEGGSEATVAVPAGMVFVHHRMPGWVDEAAYDLDAGDKIEVRAEDFQRLAPESIASRGFLERETRRNKISDWSGRIRFGVRGFGGRTVVPTQYLPAHPVVGVELRKRTPHHVYTEVDVLGGTGNGTLTFAEAGQRSTQVGSFSLGTSFGVSPYWNVPLLQFGLGVRFETVWFGRHLQDDPDGQSLLSVSGGSTLWLGLEARRFSVDLQWSWLVLAAAFDDRAKAPPYNELTVSMGYRF